VGKLFYAPYYAKAVPTFTKPTFFTNFATFTDLLQNCNIQVGTLFVKRLYKPTGIFSLTVKQFLKISAHHFYNKHKIAV